jgi:hypothetical protein
MTPAPEAQLTAEELLVSVLANTVIPRKARSDDVLLYYARAILAAGFVPISHARNEALEEAAKAVEEVGANWRLERNPHGICGFAATAIRALKDKP